MNTAIKTAGAALTLTTALLAPTCGQAQSVSVPEVSTSPSETPHMSDGVPPLQEAANEPQEQAAGDLYCRRKLGTWFYCEKPMAKPRAPTPPAPQQSADARLKEISRQLDELKARAVLEPTTQNVTAYIRFQREQLDRASTFSDVWQRAIWQTPALDYTLQRPVSTLGKRAWLDNRTADRSQVIANLSKRYGVFYFYAQSCAACDIQSPILKSVADSNHMSVVAVSMDGGPSRTFPNYVVDSGQRARMGLSGRETPALVLFDTVTKRPIPIGSGVMAADEIMDRIFALTNTKPGSDF